MSAGAWDWLCAAPAGVGAWSVGVPLPGSCAALLGSVQPLHALAPSAYAALFGLTLAVELPAWAACGAWHARGEATASGGRARVVARVVARALLANLASHPAFVLLWLRATYAWRWPVGAQLGVGEALVVVVETMVVRGAFGSWRRALLASAAVNAFSWTVGMWLQA